MDRRIDNFNQILKKIPLAPFGKGGVAQSKRQLNYHTLTMNFKKEL